MKVVMICGSPRPKNSTSGFLLQEVKQRLGAQHDVWMCHIAGADSTLTSALVRHLETADALVLAFPLYVDSIPASTLKLLRDIEAQLQNGSTSCRVYPVVNNGFYEAVQNLTAIDMVWQWCGRCGLLRGRAISVGAGEMAQMAPLGHGPSKNLGKAVDQLTSDILGGASGETVCVVPDIPRFLCKAAGNMSWKRSARKNGLKIKDLKTRR